MRNSLAQLDGAEFEGSRDLDHAYRSCDVRGLTEPGAGGAPIGRIAGIVGGLLLDAGNTAVSRLVPRQLIAVGTEPVSGATMRVLFRCRARTVELTARHILGSTDFEQAAGRDATQCDCDVLVSDHPLLDASAWGRSSAIRVAPWLRQRVELGPSWSSTLESLPSGVRKELRRWLDRRNYRARIVAGMPAKVAFYERYLLPYLTQRFGAAAMVPNMRTFSKEAESAVLLELRAADTLLGASLVRFDRATLFIGRTAFWPAQSMPSEVLDYFCFVLAQRLGCGWLDLGLTRPHVEDGVFRYKAKWQPQLVPVGGIKSDIRIRPLRSSAATLGFLSRNGFIERRGGEYLVRRLRMGGEPEVGWRSDLATLAERACLDRLVVGLTGEPSTTATSDRVTIRALGDVGDPVRAFLRLQ